MAILKVSEILENKVIYLIQNLKFVSVLLFSVCFQPVILMYGGKKMHSLKWKIVFRFKSKKKRYECKWT